LYDVAIIGAGPAGATAAAFLAARERSVLLVDQATFPRPDAHTTWVNAKAAHLLETIGLSPRETLGNPFSEITFHNADFSSSATPVVSEPLGYLLDQRVLEQHLIEAATAAGSDLHQQWPVESISLLEECVELLGPDGSAARARTLLFAAGAASPLRRQLGGPFTTPRGGHWTARVASPLEKASGQAHAVRVVLGLTRAGAFGLALLQPDCVAVQVSTPRDPETVTGLLIEMCQTMSHQGILPADLAPAAARAEAQTCPAGVALEMDSHVAKHTLIIGDAGGFVSATSDEGIYPAMWSAQIAAEVIHEALGSRHSQDVLMQFDSRWRMAMAEYLRAPNTDTQFLLPLIFANQPMADRMAAAFFCGENI